jgi:serine/threonine protein kinase
MAAEWELLLGLFEGALERPKHERAAFLDEHTKNDPALRREIETLLAAHEGAGPFLSTPALGAPAEPPDINPQPGRSSASRTRLSAGTSLGAFAVAEPLGSGGMGEVYRARDTRLDRQVAIKVLSSERDAAPGARERFEREARAISRLSHPRICTIHDIGVAALDGSDVPYLVMELLDGETLAARIARGPLSIEQSLSYAIDIADALIAAHSQGIVHRDLKPANVMLTSTGVKLLDFGLAQLRTAETAGPPVARASSVSGLTIPGVVMGTLPYASPEQLRGERVDTRTDIFAFGALLFEMLTGSRPFTADSQAGLIAAVLEHDAPPVSGRQPLTPASLDRIVQKCLAKNPDDRWQTARDLRSELVWVREGREQERIDDRIERRAATRRDDTAHRGVRWLLPAAILAGLLGLLLWSFAPRTTLPVIVLMDSPGRVYDPATAKAGGTNADDLSDALAGLPVILLKENTSSMWHREEWVRRQNPDLVISHLSALLDARQADNDALEDHLFGLAEQRLTSFFGYLGTANARTRFLIYSRGKFATQELADTWVSGVVARFPHLEGRLHTISVPGGRASATFRDPATARMFRDQVTSVLALGEARKGS